MKPSPFFAHYSFHPSFLSTTIPECSVPAVLETKHFLSTINKLLQETMAKTQAYNKIDKKRRTDILNPGDQVWLSTANLKLDCPSNKLGPKFVGPFPVKKQVNNVAYELELPNSFRVHPVFHVTLLKVT